MYRPKTARGMDAAILRCLLDERFDLWAVAALERKFGNRAAVEASLIRLRRRGLTYEIDLGFVTASRRARYGTAISTVNLQGKSRGKRR